MVAEPDIDTDGITIAGVTVDLLKLDTDDTIIEVMIVVTVRSTSRFGCASVAGWSSTGTASKLTPQACPIKNASLARVAFKGRRQVEHDTIASEPAALTTWQSHVLSIHDCASATQKH